jgi:SNF2 family DNA or RNA helicase
LPLHVFYFLVENSIEDHILNIITQKSILFEEYVEKAENFPFKNIKYEMLDYLKSKVK